MTETEPTGTGPTETAEVGPRLPSVDLAAVVAAQQDQIEDLTATVERQQQILDELLRADRTGRGPGWPRPGGGSSGTGRR